MNVNLRAIYHVTKLAVPHLIASGSGRVVNVSSVCGMRSFPNVITYCMSKAALDQMTRCMALDLASKGVRVNSVNPGVIVTEVYFIGVRAACGFRACNCRARVSVNECVNYYVLIFGRT
jgi:NAD(P)-dependent dehydrogenase (short-subunit alcohol dehydrogenase family)